MKSTTLKSAAVAAAFTLVLATTASHASTLLSLDLSALTIQADRIVVGRVLDAVAFQRQNRIYTLHRIEISNVASGKNAVGDVIEVVTEGGRIGRIRQEVSGAATLEVGAQYLLFLEDRGDPTFAYVLGMSQGAYPLLQNVNADDLTVQPSTDLPRLVSRDKLTGRLVDASPWMTKQKSLTEMLRDITNILRGAK